MVSGALRSFFDWKFEFHAQNYVFKVAFIDFPGFPEIFEISEFKGVELSRFLTEEFSSSNRVQNILSGFRIRRKICIYYIQFKLGPLKARWRAVAELCHRWVKSAACPKLGPRKGVVFEVKRWSKHCECEIFFGFKDSLLRKSTNSWTGLEGSCPLLVNKQLERITSISTPVRLENRILFTKLRLDSDFYRVDWILWNFQNFIRYRSVKLPVLK